MDKYQYIRKTITWEGKRYQVYGKTEAEAIEKLAELKASLKRGEKTISERTTVDRWFHEWIEVYKKSSGITEKSLAMYGEKYRNYIKPEIGSMKLKDVKEIHLQKIMNGQAGRSYSHCAKLRMVMQELFSKARKSRLITYDPAEDIKLPSTSRGGNRSITDQERSHILAVADTHRAGLWILTMLYAGLRPGEAAALQWKDIDFDRNEIHIYKAIESGSGAIKGPKTAAGVRDIPIHGELRRKLEAAKGEPFDYVFTMTNGNPMTSDGMQRTWRSFRRALDLEMGAKTYRNKIIQSVVAKDLTVYCLRHTFCTDLQRAGVPINVAKELMGHSNISVTANIYTHRDSDTLHANIEKLTEWESSGCVNGSVKNSDDNCNHLNIKGCNDSEKSL